MTWPHDDAALARDLAVQVGRRLLEVRDLVRPDGRPRYAEDRTAQEAIAPRLGEERQHIPRVIAT